MTELVVACVRTGTKYGFDYVTRLQAMVARHLPVSHRFVCLSDTPFQHDNIGYVDIGKYGLAGWWGKMALFAPEWRRGKQVIYLDLDTLVVGDLTGLATLSEQFGICANFTRQYGHSTWPCRYGSCVMVIPEQFSPMLWQQFRQKQSGIMKECGRYGDQMAIEKLIPHALLLQYVLPEGYFLGKRELFLHKHGPPVEASVVVFGGSVTPANCKVGWVNQIWGQYA